MAGNFTPGTGVDFHYRGTTDGGAPTSGGEFVLGDWVATPTGFLFCLTGGPAATATWGDISEIPSTGIISDTAYDRTTWDAVTGVAPSKNAVRDKFEVMAPLLPGYKTGKFYGPEAGGTTRAMTANTQRLIPYLVRSTQRFDQLSIEITTAGSAGTVYRLGVYNNDPTRGRPGTLILDAGTVPGDAAPGVQAATIDLTLPPGWVWLGIAGQVLTGSPVLRGLAGGVPGFDESPSSGAATSGCNNITNDAAVAGAFGDLSAATFTPSSAMAAILLRAVTP